MKTVDEEGGEEEEDEEENAEEGLDEQVNCWMESSDSKVLHVNHQTAGDS